MTRFWLYSKTAAVLFEVRRHPYREDVSVFNRSQSLSVLAIYTHVHKGKGKVKLSLCFIWAPRHEGVLGEWRYSATHSLTSALVGVSGQLHVRLL
jgi:cation transport regulator ChaC